jgi:hypothetical protein
MLPTAPKRSLHSPGQPGQQKTPGRHLQGGSQCTAWHHWPTWQRCDRMTQRMGQKPSSGDIYTCIYIYIRWYCIYNLNICIIIITKKTVYIFADICIHIYILFIELLRHPNVLLENCHTISKLYVWENSTTIAEKVAEPRLIKLTFWFAGL